MEIVTVTDQFPPHIGGMSTHVWELNKALAALDQDVTVLTASEMFAGDRRFWRANRSHESCGVKILQFGGLGYLRTTQVRNKIVRWLQANALRKGEGVLHLHDMDSPPWVAAAGSRTIVWTNHSSPYLRVFEDKNRHDELKATLSACTWVTAPSRELLEKSIAVGFPEERATYIPNGVDTDRFKPNPDGAPKRIAVGEHVVEPHKDKTIVVCARRFVWKNGLHQMVEAMRMLSERDSAARAVFVFAGNDEADMKTEYGKGLMEDLRELRNRLDVRVLGAVPNDLMPQVWANADVCVLPSIMEATSIAGLEAMSCGVPIVGMAIGGIPEIVEDGETGLLCSPGKAESLAEQLERLISSRELCGRLGMNARKRAESEFSWTHIAGRFLDVYERALAVG